MARRPRTQQAAFDFAPPAAAMPPATRATPCPPCAPLAGVQGFGVAGTQTVVCRACGRTPEAARLGALVPLMVPRRARRACAICGADVRGSSAYLDWKDGRDLR